MNGFAAGLVRWMCFEVARIHALRLAVRSRNPLLQHYVVKTIENIAGQGGLWAHKFATPEVVASLSQVLYWTWWYVGTIPQLLHWWTPGVALASVCQV